MAASITCMAAAASAQTPALPSDHGHKHIGPVLAAPHVDVTARVDLLDERIAMLTADMRMFVGELKIQAMADLIEALIERQTLTERSMHRMHEKMREWMPSGNAPGPRSVEPESTEMDPETMCSPYSPYI
jgi:hypothetical protein